MGSVDAGTHDSAVVDGNIAIGVDALLGGDFDTSDKDLLGNIAIGYNSLGGATTTEFTSIGNVVIGAGAGEDMVGGAAYNTIVGQDGGKNITQGDYIL